MIRAARLEDAEAIARVQIDTWRAAYRGIVWDSTLDSLSLPTRARLWSEMIDDRAGGRFMLVAEDAVSSAAGGAVSGSGASDSIVGFAAAGPIRSADAAYPGELYAIYVLPTAQRRGLGAGLVRGVATRLAGAGMSSMLLWVFEANGPARRFYESLGGTVVRTQPIDIAGQTLTEVAYGWSDLRGLLSPR